MTFPVHDYRVLVTGSRKWTNALAVQDVLMGVYIREVHQAPGWRLVVVHGACPTGADAMAHYWATDMESRGHAITAEPHPADWDKHGKAAGFIRNTEMAKDPRGADECIAFLKRDAENKGTHHCVIQAKAAGIHVTEYEG